MNWVIVGAGAQGRITLDVLRSSRPMDTFVFLDDDQCLQGKNVLGLEIMSRAWLRQQIDRTMLRGIVAIGRNDVRLRIALELEAEGIAWGNVIHPSSVVHPSATLETGIFLGAGSVVVSGGMIGRQALINTGVVVEHDCMIEEGASLGPGVVTGGRVTVGRAAFIGAGATLLPRISIGAGAIIGAGAVVTRDVGPAMLAYGAPAREIRPVQHDRDWARLL